MASTTGKRTILTFLLDEDLDDECEENAFVPPEPKRRKTIEGSIKNSSTTSCNLFDNSMDKNQFESILNSLISIAWKKTYDINVFPTAILRIIAFQATGKIILCPRCKITETFYINDNKYYTDIATKPSICDSPSCDRILACCVKTWQSKCGVCQKYYCNDCWRKHHSLVTGLGYSQGCSTCDLYDKLCQDCGIMCSKCRKINCYDCNACAYSVIKLCYTCENLYCTSCCMVHTCVQCETDACEHCDDKIGWCAACCAIICSKCLGTNANTTFYQCSVCFLEYCGGCVNKQQSGDISFPCDCAQRKLISCKKKVIKQNST